MSEEHPLPKHVVRIKKLRSLLAIVENSLKGGDNYLFRNLFADEGGNEIDILENGQNSCCAVVTWPLLALELIKHPHATVHGTEKDLGDSGWFEIQDRRAGAVLIWGPKQASVHGLLGDKTAELQHIGFCVSETEAISNDSKRSGFPIRHDITYNGDREITKILWHSDLDKG